MRGEKGVGTGERKEGKSKNKKEKIIETKLW